MPIYQVISKGRVIFLIFALCFFVRILFADAWNLWNVEPQFGNDDYTYQQLARSIVQGKGFALDKPVAFYPPLYSFFLAFNFLLFGEQLPVVMLFQAALAGIAAILVFLIGTTLFPNRSAGFIGAMLFIFEKNSIALTTTLFTENLFVPLALASVLLMLRYEQGRQIRPLFFASIFAGLSMLTRPTYLLFYLSFLIIQAYRKQFRQVFFSIVIVGFILAPWAVRNYLVFHKFIPVSNNFPVVFWLGNHFTETEAQEFSHDRAQLTDEQLNDKYPLAKTFDSIRRHPSEYLRATVQRFTTFFSDFDGHQDFWLGSRAFRLILELLGAYLLLFANIWRTGKKYFYGFVITQSLVYIFSFATSRYQLSVMPLLTILGGFALTLLFLNRKRTIDRVLLVIVLSTLFINPFDKLSNFYQFIISTFRNAVLTNILIYILLLGFISLMFVIFLKSMDLRGRIRLTVFIFLVVVSVRVLISGSVHTDFYIQLNNVGDFIQRDIELPTWLKGDGDLYVNFLMQGAYGPKGYGAQLFIQNELQQEFARQHDFITTTQYRIKLDPVVGSQDAVRISVRPTGEFSPGQYLMFWGRKGHDGNSGTVINQQEYPILVPDKTQIPKRPGTALFWISRDGNIFTKVYYWFGQAHREG